MGKKSKTSAISTQNRLRLFNCWGKEIYSKNGYLDEWDGSDLSNGVYFYELEISGKVPLGQCDGGAVNFTSKSLWRL